MTPRKDLLSADLARSARTRVRLPDTMVPSGVFSGWGPTV
jgi:hypothetical protein